MASGTENKAIFEEMPVRKALSAMVAPTIISQIIVLIYNMADTFYVGRANNPLMVAGVSLILPIFNITMCLVNLAGVGGGTLVSRLLGKREEDQARKVSAFAFYFGLAAALLFSIGVGVFMTPLLHALGAGEGTFLYAKQYVTCVIVLGAAPTVLSNVSAALLRSTGRSKAASFGITMGGVLNIILDPVFMFLVLKPGQEVLGVGIATLLSNSIVCVYFLITLFRVRKQSVLTMDPRVGLPTGENARAVFTVGIPAALATFLFDIDYIVIDRLMVSYSDIALASVGIVLKVERLPLNVGVGICQGMVPLIAYNFAARNYKRMNDTISNARALGLIVGAASVVLYEIFAWYIIRFFISNAETVALASQFLRVRVLATPFMFLCFFTVHLFQGVGKGGTSLFLGVFRWAALNIPMLFLFNRIFGMFGIVWTQVTADAIMAAISLVMFFRYKRKLSVE